MKKEIEIIRVKVNAPHIRGEGVLKRAIKGHCIVELPNGVFVVPHERDVLVLPPVETNIAASAA